MANNKSQYIVPMVERAVEVLNYLFEKSDHAGVREISAAIDVPQATVYRILYTLKEYGFVTQGDDDLYYLGQTFISYGSMVKKSMGLSEVTRPLMEDAAARIGEFINLGSLYENQVIILEEVAGEEFFIGKHLVPVMPLYCSGLGKVFLSNFSKTDLNSYLKKVNLEPRTVSTIVTPSELLREIEDIKKEGISYDREEYEYGLTCCATSVGSVGSQQLAISISGPTSRIMYKGMDKMKEELIELAKNVQTALKEVELPLV